MPKPADFFVGVTTLFAVLIPGAVLVFVVAPYARFLFDGSNLPSLTDGFEFWIAIAFASYLLGQMAYSGGDVLAGRLKLNDLFERWLFATKLQKLEDISRGYLPSETLRSNEMLKDTVRAFVRLNSAAGSAAIDQMEAEYKFFRSLSAVLLLAVAIYSLRGAWLIASGALVLLLIALALYGDRRRRRIENDYLYFLILRGAAGEAMASPDTEVGAAAPDS